MASYYHGAISVVMHVSGRVCHVGAPVLVLMVRQCNRREGVFLNWAVYRLRLRRYTGR
jgi:hypothetical protein